MFAPMSDWKSGTDVAVAQRVRRWMKKGGVKRVYVKEKRWVVKEVDKEMSKHIAKRNIIFAQRLADRMNKEKK